MFFSQSASIASIRIALLKRVHAYSSFVVIRLQEPTKKKVVTLDSNENSMNVEAERRGRQSPRHVTPRCCFPRCVSLPPPDRQMRTFYDAPIENQYFFGRPGDSRSDPMFLVVPSNCQPANHRWSMLRRYSYDSVTMGVLGELRIKNGCQSMCGYYSLYAVSS